MGSFKGVTLINVLLDNSQFTIELLFLLEDIPEGVFVPTPDISFDQVKLLGNPKNRCARYYGAPPSFNAILELWMRVTYNFIPKWMIFPCSICGNPEEQGVVIRDCSREGIELQGTNSQIARDEKTIKYNLNKILSLPNIGPSEFFLRQFHIHQPIPANEVGKISHVVRVF